MIKASDAIRVACSLLGTPYGTGPGKLDCINLIKKVIRTAPGGVKNYTTAGTNTLWRSYDSSDKYRDITTRQIGIDGAKAGMIAFKHSGDDYHHAGIVTDVGTVIHASSAQGETVETPLTAAQGWTALAVHRYIEPDYDGGTKEETMESYRATVRLSNPSSTLNVRSGPSTGDRVVDRINHGDEVTVQANPGNTDWAFVSYGGKMGYVSAQYLERAKDETEEDGIEDSGAEGEAGEPGIVLTTLISDDGQQIRLAGRWSIAED